MYIIRIMRRVSRKKLFYILRVQNTFVRTMKHIDIHIGCYLPHSGIKNSHIIGFARILTGGSDMSKVTYMRLRFKQKIITLTQMIHSHFRSIWGTRSIFQIDRN